VAIDVAVVTSSKEKAQLLSVVVTATYIAVSSCFGAEAAMYFFQLQHRRYTKSGA
jgi:hypothetical protein